MGVRIAVIIALSTLFSYFHMYRTLRTEALAQLEQHVAERGQREQAIFVLAEDNHALLKKALEERLQELSPEEVNARFERLFVQRPDGTFRNRAEGLDDTREPCVFIPRGVNVDLDMRRRILASYDVISWYGPAFHVRFTNTAITLPEGALILYWPGNATWCLEVAPDFRITDFTHFTISLPQNDPERKTIWSGVYQDPVSNKPMASISTPVDQEGRHLATLSHDVLLEELMARTINDHLPGAYNLIFRDDGELIAHAEQTGATDSRAHLQDIIEQAKNHGADATVLELPRYGEYLALARLQGPGWNFATVLPESTVTRPAFNAARIVLLLGILSLGLELAILYWVLQQQITRPLLAFTQASDRVAAGEFHVELDTSRGDELGQLARAFRSMADQVQRREEELRHANEDLEQRVEERTHELKEVHMQLVQTARRAGMAEIATNVLHNVGNVLNSVYTSAQLAKERVVDLRVEHVGRIALLLQERQSDLGTFLTQDTRGRNVMPLLNKLGQNLLDERQQIVSLLDEVGRYTEHVGDIVKVQQNYARTPRLHESVRLADLVEDALRINSAGLIRHQVKVVRHLAALPPILTDKNKTLMILVNLVSNAKYAMDGVPPAERTLRVELEPAESDRVRIQVHDNGMGIAPEMLTRIFQYGFTTREEGHGFGLHSSAIAAQEMGGSLTVHSNGPGHGATFTLELPYLPHQEAA
ncbi:ATP-binding protein [Cystobacter ferrugineus]|uniref:histidine kinase n=1 Tax=Cystobacter ferrugineus TaxID=83449 RepID=A0A1L9B4B9_9BACT|nr:ATP-binding protein [Cystobacter ferrugineus]OJH37084.1 histidine kinase [Cystobacter ferrugineus]